MLGTLPDRKSKMPPLTRRAATINYLVEPIQAVHGYKTQRDFCDDLIDSNRRLFNLAVAALPVGICIGFIAGLYCR